MNTPKQHVDIFRKLLLRKRLLSKAVDGAAYVPFIGDGDLAVQLYADRKIFGGDLDAARVGTARSRLRAADIRTADCDGWPFAGCRAKFAVADFDAYSNPYPALQSFWKSALKSDRIVLFGTDGRRRAINGFAWRSNSVRLPSGEKVGQDSGLNRRMLYNFWWSKQVRPWLAGLIRPYRIVVEQHYQRRDMLYWGAVVEK